MLRDLAAVRVKRKDHVGAKKCYEEALEILRALRESVSRDREIARSRDPEMAWLVQIRIGPILNHCVVTVALRDQRAAQGGADSVAATVLDGDLARTLTEAARARARCGDAQGAADAYREVRVCNSFFSFHCIPLRGEVRIAWSCVESCDGQRVENAHTASSSALEWSHRLPRQLVRSRPTVTCLM